MTMTKQEVADYIKELQRKEAMKEELTIGEICILDMHKGVTKEGGELTEAGIQETLFMMD